MRKMHVLLLGTIALLVLVGGWKLFSSLTGTGHAQASSRDVTSYSSAPGLPAIIPHLHKPQISSSLTPSFTIEDARKYVTTHPIPNVAPSTAGLSIYKVAFLPSREVSRLMKGESTGVADTVLLCYVELHGKIIVYGRGGAGILHTVVEVFDAQTGNLLISGGQ